jgi:hypothetical protein
MADPGETITAKGSIQQIPGISRENEHKNEEKEQTGPDEMGDPGTTFLMLLEIIGVEFFEGRNSFVIFHFEKLGNINRSWELGARSQGTENRGQWAEDSGQRTGERGQELAGAHGFDSPLARGYGFAVLAHFVRVMTLLRS